MTPRNIKIIEECEGLLKSHGDDFYLSLDAAVRNFKAREEKKRLFDLVKDKEHWKGPINAIVSDKENAEAICDAVNYFTGTYADVEDLGDGTMRVEAPGYWGGPCN